MFEEAADYADHVDSKQSSYEPPPLNSELDLLYNFKVGYVGII